MLPNHNDCTGCTACAAICPVGCIEMETEAGGFKYPKIDSSSCIHCNKCEQTCPVLSINIDGKSTIVKGIQNKNSELREKSTAGGFVSVISEYIFKNGGVVYGACFNKDLSVSHRRLIDFHSCEEYKLFGSKYVTSDVNDCLKSLKEDLQSDRYVCFIGLPCQVAGVSKFVGELNEKLILIDLTCYGAPSPLLYKKYLEYCKSKFGVGVEEVNFRDKSFGYSVPTMSIKLSNGRIKGQDSVSKSYLRAYFADLACRKSCYSCKFKTIDRVSDFTIGDCKTIGKYDKVFDDDKGTTAVYIHSKKGKEIFSKVKNYMSITDLPIDDVLKTCGEKMTQSMKCNENRDDFINSMNDLTYESLIKKYCPPHKDEYIASFLKRILLHTGLNKTKILRKLKGR